ncbi:non-ribosomal peptide synthetase [Streptomyces virginiae]|uniref:non-ribosomal peptide synthetase n=1 Tax=Streptomyces virginiae TaxID=1961 RepID=UPI0036EDE12A
MAAAAEILQESPASPGPADSAAPAAPAPPPDTAGEVPSALPLGGGCPAGDPCITVRRSLPLPAGLAARFVDRPGDLLVAAALVLGRKYADGTAFRVGVRRSGAPQAAPVVPLTAAMPGELTAARHLEAVSAALAAAPGADTQAEPLPVVCIPDGPAIGLLHGADLVLSAETGTGAPAASAVLHADVHTHRVDPDSGDRLLGHLAVLIGQFTERPETTLAGLRLLTVAELEQLRALNDTRRPFPDSATLCSLFTEQVTAHPDRSAVIHEDGSLTYRELDDRSRRLAGVLHSLGVRHGDRVAFAHEKGPQLLVTVLAILRVGAAYVPIGAGTPTPRRNHLLADSDACLLLAAGADAVDAPVPVLDPAGALPETPQAPEATGSAGDAAYVMYTSGTTGRPKGVLVSQRAVVRLVRDTDYVRLSPATRILQTGAVAFDATTFEFWGALLNGGAVVFVPSETVLSAAGLRGAIRRHGVTTLFLTTALFHQLTEQDPAALRGTQVLIGGETMSARHLAMAREHCPDTEFVHVYGPTENTTFSVAHPLTGRYEGRVPIGRPLANSTAHVLDRDGNPQPFGIAGELYVGGAGLSDGYLGRPDLDTHAFVRRATSAADADGTERLYRTGDRARWTADGLLDFLGRTDHQVKIRGFRVELAEVEARLTALPGVREAAVLLCERAAGVRVLSAFYTAAPDTGAERLRAALLAELPEYMVPSSFTRLEALPLNRNQKVDRAVLRDLEPAAGPAAPAGPRPAGRAPRTEREAVAAAVFAEVLGVPSVSVDDNFYDLGGHSLLATRLWSGLRAALGVEFPLRRILDAPTVAGLVASLDLDPAPRPAAARPKLVRRSS